MEQSRDWVSLPRELTVMILSRVRKVDLVRSARLVCSTWHRICKEPCVYRSIELSCSWDELACFSYENVCRYAVSYSSGQLLDISIEGFCSDRLLTYIAQPQRSRQIKRLKICYPVSLSGEMLDRAFQNLPLLEEIEICKFRMLLLSLHVLSRCCPRLTTLKLNSIRDMSVCVVLDNIKRGESSNIGFEIARNFPRLRVLELRESKLGDDGLIAILDACPLLESLDLLGCYKLMFHGNLLQRLVDQIKYLQLPPIPVGSRCCSFKNVVRVSNFFR